MCPSEYALKRSMIVFMQQQCASGSLRSYSKYSKDYAFFSPYTIQLFDSSIY